ncbi:MAG: ethanolamine ammonia-lyase light chain EutC, partial [Sphingobacteriaceae bacterium]|nr:ethanolamine ammonia-lyase light chain EutC [Cytophagaceae bacterium]
NHAVPVLEKLVPACREWGWTLAPVCLVEQGRVAVADEIGALLRVEIALILLGERPGLSSPDSLGAYLTYAPRPGLSDEARNCVSNIRTEGMSYELAAAKLLWLLSEMKTRRLSGVSLKDEMGGFLEG